MTAETDDLVLELLRGRRGAMDGLRRDIAAVKDHDARVAAPVHRRIQKARLLDAISRSTTLESVVRHMRRDESSVRVGPREGARV